MLKLYYLINKRLAKQVDAAQNDKMDLWQIKKVLTCHFSDTNTELVGLNIFSIFNKKFYMKNCPKCNSEIEENFNICWNCNYSLTEDRVVEFEEIYEKKRDVNCLRCNVKLIYSGNYKFHEGTKFGMWSNLMEIFVNRESFDLYLCPKCGKVEFYAPS